jgi:hypothetical protein
MYRQAEISEYQEAIRKHVCSRCSEKPPGAPPCAPLGKRCALELHLPEVLSAIHAVRSASIRPYLESIRRRVCNQCSLPGVDCCPCPADRLLALAVRAVDAVDQAWEEDETAKPTSKNRRVGMDPLEGYPSIYLDRLEDE